MCGIDWKCFCDEQIHGLGVMNHQHPKTVFFSSVRWKCNSMIRPMVKVEQMRILQFKDDTLTMLTIMRRSPVILENTNSQNCYPISASVSISCWPCCYLMLACFARCKRVDVLFFFFLRKRRTSRVGDCFGVFFFGMMSDYEPRYQALRNQEYLIRTGPNSRPRALVWSRAWFGLWWSRDPGSPLSTIRTIFSRRTDYRLALDDLNLSEGRPVWSSSCCRARRVRSAWSSKCLQGWNCASLY